MAKVERGTRTRNQVFGDESELAFNTYANFETGASWPRGASLRRIERLLGWKAGAIEEALASGLDPALIDLPHMRGERPFVLPSRDIRVFSDEEIYREAMRRHAESEGYGLAASNDLGGAPRNDDE